MIEVISMPPGIETVTSQFTDPFTTRFTRPSITFLALIFIRFIPFPIGRPA
jgi:hypothetical protein